MTYARRLYPLLFAGFLALSSAAALKAGLCFEHIWTPGEITAAPLLAVGRVVSLARANGPHFMGDPKHSAPPQVMTAEVGILRFTQQAASAEAIPPGRLKVRFIGRDGPDFSQCPTDLPDLEPGQVLLLPLRTNARSGSEPWQLIGTDGYRLTMRVASKMEEPAPVPHDTRSFFIRELVNSLRNGDPIARFTAASVVASNADSLEPEFTAQLQKSIGNNTAQWAQVLANMLLQYPSASLTLAEVRTGKPNPHARRFQGFPLAQLALSHLPGKDAETLVWQSLMTDLPGFADEPYHPLFSYNSNDALRLAGAYLSRCRENPAFLTAIKTALRKDRPGSSYLAARLIDEGQDACLPEALSRAMKVLRRPAADGGDVLASLRLVLKYGTNRQRTRLSEIALQLKNTNPDYTAYLQRMLMQSPRKHP